MVQTVATLISLGIAAGALAVIVGALAEDWAMVVRALRRRPAGPPSLLPAYAGARTDRRACVIRVSAQSSPRRAAA